MIKQILAISGKPGLYKLVSRGNKSLIVETVDEQKKRMPAFGADRVVSLGDISIYTNDDNEVSLASVFQSIKQNYDGKAVDLSPKKADQDDIIAFFAKVLPNYDTDRVRVSDMRKVLSWYNILINNGINEFESKEEEGAEEGQKATEE
jgi:LytS/YehU family sensor histidine kinase